MNHKNCEKLGCTKAATNTIRLSLAVHADHEPAISDPLLYLCDEHAVECTWQTLGIDYNWDNICNQFEAIGRLAPLKEFSKIEIRPLR